MLSSPYTLDVLTQQLILLSASASPLFRLVVLRCNAVVTGRSDLHHAADRLDTVTVTVLVNEGVQDLLRRSSSASGKISTGRAEDLACFTQLTILAPKAFDTVPFLSRLTGRWPLSVWFAHPAMQRSVDTTNLG